MKKQLLSFLALSLCISSYAQNRQIVKNIKDLKLPTNSHLVPALNLGISGDELPLKKNSITQLSPTHQTAKVTATDQVIGSTTYDLQSNGSSIASRFYNSGNDLGTAWTFSSDVAGTYNDRGTGVVRSSDNGATWDPFSNLRIESKRTGFGSIDRLGTGEVVVSHNAGAPLTLWSHATTSAPWDSSMIPYPAGMGYPLWMSMKVGGNNGTTIHMVTATAPTNQTPAGALFNGMDGAMIYYRSVDGGVTWNTPIQLPESDTSASSPYLNFRANSYAIDAKGDNVAVVSGSVAADWSLWKSTDNGTTWTRTPIMAFPKPKFDQVTMDTDTNADGIGDTLICSDGAVSVVIDNNGIAHCFTGAMAVLEEPGAGALGLFLETNGLLYWNENMGSNPAVVIAQASTALPFAANLEPRYGNDGLCSMPSAGVDASNNIYVAYSSLKGGTDDGANGWSYHNIWAQASMDGGNTWLAPFIVLDDNFTEEVFPSVARDVDYPSCFHLMYQRDGAPGYTVPPNGVGTIGPNDIVYSCIDPVVDLGVIVGISQISSPSFGISISPNPASESAILKYTLDKAASVKINIADVLGQTVYSNEVMMIKGANNLSVNLKNFDSGVYFVNSTIDGKIYTDKLSVK